MSLTIKIFQVGCGDAIGIRFLGLDNSYCNILIDGGYKNSYLRTIKKEINDEILAKKEKIDLWIFTHIDKDHINGAIAFLNDNSFEHNQIVKKIWYNYSSFQYELPSESNKIGVSEGIKLRDKIKKLGITIIENVSNQIEKQEINTCKITILSPSQKGLDTLKAEWKEFEEKQNSLIASSSDDYKTTINDLSQLENQKEKKDDFANYSSIAFLFEFEQNKILFLGDAHISVVVQSLRDLGYSEQNRLRVDYIKLAHHGSKNNYNPLLLDVVDCSNFIVSASGGGTYNLPNKEVLAKILQHEKRDLTKQITFIFNHDNSNLRRIFAIDTNAEKIYNFKCLFPATGQNAFTLTLL